MRTKLILFAVLCGNFALFSQTFSNETFRLNNTSFYAPCVVDMNMDGLDDVVTFVSSGGIDMHIDYQQTDGTFVGVYFDENFADSPDWSISAGDLTGNGYNDLMIGNGNSVTFIKANNDGTGYTQQPMVGYIFSQRNNIVDIDNDGDLDAFQCHDVGLSKPYRNDGSGNMTEDHTLISTVPLDGNYASVWTDFDNDGDVDMYMSKCKLGSSPGDTERENALYVNDGNGNYTQDVSNTYGLFDNEQSWVTIFEDFDNDGDLDTYTVNHTDQNFLRWNDGLGHYSEDTSGTTGLELNDLGSWACIGADFDNDGFIDILMDSDASVDKRLYHNNGNSTFTGQDMPFDRGALGDLNNDGFIDVFTGSTLYMNDGNANHWFKVALQGTQSNFNGIGARLELYGNWGVQVRESRSGENFAPMSSLDVFFGLGSETVIDSLVVRWPSGQVDVITSPTHDTELLVIETELTSNLRLTKVDPSVQEVTIRNFGTVSQDISDYRLCSNINYTFSGIATGTSIVTGDLDLGPDEEVTVNWNIAGAFRETGDDMGLYLPSGSFTDPNAMVDYMQYITLNGGREAVAVAKGIWTDDETVTGDPAYTYIGEGIETGASFWEGAGACDPGGAPVDLTKSFDPVNGVQDRVQVKWYKDSPQVKYTDEDAVACDIKFWAKRNLDPITGSPIGPAITNPDTILIKDAKKFLPDGISPKSIFKWPVKFRADGANNNKRAEPNIRYEWQVRCACDHGEGAETPWSTVKIFNTPDFDPTTGIYTPPPGVEEGLTEAKSMLADLSELLTVFPNPTDGDLILKCAESIMVDYQLIDLSGRTLMSDRIFFDKSSQLSQLDISAQPNGIYLLTIQSEVDIVTLRVIKK